MKTAAVIAEFNPLHSGHAYFLEKVREQSGADRLVVIMSGDYVQRGEPAVFDKYVRTKAALCCGADLVLELPVRYAVSNAGDFALGAVRIPDALSAVDELWFGSECGSIGPFEEASGILASESERFKQSLADSLKSGLPYPKARALAAADAAGGALFGGSREALLSFLESPNNILGLEYCIALARLKSRIVPKTLMRKGSGYHADCLGSGLPSASAVRNVIGSEGISAAAGHVPGAAFSLYRRYCSEGAPVFADDFSLILKYRLLSCGMEELSSFSGVSEDLAQRIVNHLNEFAGFTQFADLIKTRNLTRSHVDRALLSVLLNIRKSPVPSVFRTARILGMGSCGDLLAKIKEKGSISLCSSYASVTDGSYSDDLFASNLYESVKAFKSGRPFVHEYERRLLKHGSPSLTGPGPR